MWVNFSQPARIQAPARTSGSVYFRGKTPDKADEKQSVRKGNVLLPDRIPVHFIHGTFNTAEMMRPIVEFFKDIRTRHPIYMSFLPEVRDATGIEQVEDPTTTLPAYKAAIREMGDFRYQVVYKNIRSLEKLLNTADGKSVKNQALADFFEILPGERRFLLPLVKEHLVKPIFSMPPEFINGDPLALIVKKRMALLKQEVDKLDLSEAERQQEIFDPHFLNNKAREQGKKVNLDMNTLVEEDDTINLRLINFNDIAVLESYLMYMEKKLTKALETSYSQRHARLLEKGDLTPDELAKWSQMTARKLMERIAPQAMVLGHSQGGTTVLSALINYLEKAPKEPEKAFLPNAPGAEVLGGRSMGLAVLFSAPVQGIPDEPAWAEELLSMRLFNNRLHFPRTVLKKTVWGVLSRHRPAVLEMKEGSPLSQKFQEKLPLIKGTGITVVSVHDLQDTHVEPEATRLTSKNGDSLPNVFNVPVLLPGLKHDYGRGKNIIKTEYEKFSMEPQNTLMRQLLATVEKTQYIPRQLQQVVAQFLVRYLRGLAHHRALLDFPEHIRIELGKQFIVDPKEQANLLNTTNFEPFRYQALITRGKIYRKHVLDKPLPEALKALKAFSEQYPEFLPAIIENAWERLPVQNSAAYEATQILTQTLEVLEQAVYDKSLKSKYRANMEKSLREIASANLKPLVKGQPALSKKAQQLLTILKKS